MLRFVKYIPISIFAGTMLTACTLLQSPRTSTSSIPTNVPIASPATLHDPVTIKLGARNGSGQSGSALLEDLGTGKTKVTITVTGKFSKEGEPSHIHTGTCAKPGNVVYPLTDTVSGKSETIVPANLATILKNGAILNVHKSAKEANVYVSCGELSVSSTPAKK